MRRALRPQAERGVAAARDQEFAASVEDAALHRIVVPGHLVLDVAPGEG